MKKAGILTFHEAINYGAVMQAYALKTAIGDKAEIIPYRSEHISKGYNLLRRFIKGNLKSKVAFLLFENWNAASKKKKFQRFVRNNLVSSERIILANEVETIGKEYSVVISGSDQVFNLECTGNDFVYFLDFNMPDNVKRVAYAASFGSRSVPEQYKKEIKQAIDKFDGLAVREKAGQEIINNLTDKESIVVLDPTLIIDRKYWIKLAEQASIKKSKYVFVYTITYDKDLLLFAKKIAGNDKTVIYVGPISRDLPKGIKCIKNCGPEEWLAYIKQSVYVVTNAFHGIALSLAMQKQVYIGFPPGVKAENNDRIYNIVEKFGLQNRLYKEFTRLENMSYEQINDKMNHERKYSLEYLEKNVLRYL